MLSPDQIQQYRSQVGIQDNSQPQPTSPNDLRGEDLANYILGSNSQDQNSLGSSFKMGAQAIGNMPKDAFQTAKDFTVGTAQNIAAIPGQVGQLVKESGGVLPAIKNFAGATDALPQNIYKAAVPSFADKLIHGDVQGATQDVVQHPVREVLPVALGLESPLENLGEKASNVVSDSATKIGENVSNVASKVASKAGLGAETPESLLGSSLKRVTPDLNSMSITQREKLINQNVLDEAGKQVPRVNEGGMVNSRTINLSSYEKSAAQELSKVPGYSDKLTNLETHNLIKSAISNEAKTLRTGLRAEKIAVPPQEIKAGVRNAILKTSKESLILQKADPVIKNYMRVLSNSVSQEPGTLEGVLNIRQSLDDAYENARGKLAYGSDRMSALDEVHHSARNYLNDYMNSKARNTQVKDLLSKQTNLYRADDAILPKAATEGGSTLERGINKIEGSPAGKLIKKIPGAKLILPGK